MCKPWAGSCSSLGLEKYIICCSSLFHVPDFSLIKGGLVKKILETKKDYESSPSAIKSKDQVHFEY